MGLHSIEEMHGFKHYKTESCRKTVIDRRLQSIVKVQVSKILNILANS